MCCGVMLLLLIIYNIYIGFICTFLTKAACCRKIEIVLHPTILSHIYIYIYIVSLYLCVPDEGSLLPKYRDCTTFNDFESYLMCCGVMLQ